MVNIKLSKFMIILENLKNQLSIKINSIKNLFLLKILIKISFIISIESIQILSNKPKKNFKKNLNRFPNLKLNQIYNKIKPTK